MGQWAWLVSPPLLNTKIIQNSWQLDIHHARSMAKKVLSHPHLDMATPDENLIVDVPRQLCDHCKSDFRFRNQWAKAMLIYTPVLEWSTIKMWAHQPVSTYNRKTVEYNVQPPINLRHSFPDSVSSRSFFFFPGWYPPVSCYRMQSVKLYLLDHICSYNFISICYHILDGEFIFAGPYHWDLGQVADQVPLWSTSAMKHAAAATPLPAPRRLAVQTLEDLGCS